MKKTVRKTWKTKKAAEKIGDQKKQLVKKNWKKKKEWKNVWFLKDSVDGILNMNDMNFNKNGEDILKKLARYERMINYGNLIF